MSLFLGPQSASMLLHHVKTWHLFFTAAILDFWIPPKPLKTVRIGSKTNKNTSKMVYKCERYNWVTRPLCFPLKLSQDDNDVQYHYFITQNYLVLTWCLVLTVKPCRRFPGRPLCLPKTLEAPGYEAVIKLWRFPLFTRDIVWYTFDRVKTRTDQHWMKNQSIKVLGKAPLHAN